MSENPEIYSLDYYQRIFELEEKHWWYLGMREIACQIIERYYTKSKGLRILDSGCGTGMMLSWMEKYSVHKKIVGIDVSNYAIKYCQKREKDQLAQASITHLPIKSELFDLVVCNDVIQHLPKDGGDIRALGEIYGILKPGGVLFLRSNARRNKADHEKEDDFNFHKYTLDELKQKLIQVGFLIEQMTYANFLPSIYGELKSWLISEKNSHRYQGFSVKMPPYKWLNNLLYIMLKKEAKYLSKPQRSLPFGHTLICFAKKPN